ncbi:sulfotransferase family protein [Alteromonas flava]|uniref:sulfotransferase family protein n=1 Tax=Alteromonas flava TaxID=2048003 RepID=UPI000C292A35|nr:sulfotransferase [Alteromonas flava]
MVIGNQSLTTSQALETVRQLLGAGRIEPAWQKLCEIESLAPENVELLTHMVGILLGRKQQQADEYIKRLCIVIPHTQDAHLYVHVLRLLCQYHQYAAALTVAKRVPKVLQANQDVLVARCNVAVQARALTAARQWLDIQPAAPELAPKARLMRANIAAMLGDFDAAQADYLAILQEQPDNSYAAAGLAKSQKLTPELDEHLAMLPLVNDDPEAAARVLFAQAKAKNDRGNYGVAWQLATRANALKSKTCRFSSTMLQQQVDGLLTAFSMDNYQSAKSNCVTEHVFVVGMPRSGTTLVEQILSSVPEYYAGGETPALEVAIAASGVDEQYLQRLMRQERIDWQATIKAYENYFQQFANFAGERIVNKVPTNFFHIGLIKLLFPHAKIINMQRDPLDLAVSIYFENFSRYFAYTNDLDDIFFVYDQYQRLMSHWQSMFGDDILHVSYQQLVADYAPGAARIGDFLGVSLPPAEVIRESTNHVETPSIWQVRQPITTHAVARWQRYTEFLTPYIERYR